MTIIRWLFTWGRISGDQDASPLRLLLQTSSIFFHQVEIKRVVFFSTSFRCLTKLSLLFAGVQSGSCRQPGRDLWALAHARSIYDRRPEQSRWKCDRLLSMQQRDLSLSNRAWRPRECCWSASPCFRDRDDQQATCAPVALGGWVVRVLINPQVLVVTAEAFWAYQRNHQRGGEADQRRGICWLSP